MLAIGWMFFSQAVVASTPPYDSYLKLQLPSAIAHLSYQGSQIFEPGWPNEAGKQYEYADADSELVIYSYSIWHDNHELKHGEIKDDVSVGSIKELLIQRVNQREYSRIQFVKQDWQRIGQIEFEVDYAYVWKDGLQYHSYLAASNLHQRLFFIHFLTPVKADVDDWEAVKAQWIRQLR